MNKHALNAIGWTLLFPAFLFAFGGIPVFDFGVSATVTALSAVASVLLFCLVATTVAIADDPPELSEWSLRDNNSLHTEPRAARFLETMIFAAAR